MKNKVVAYEEVLSEPLFEYAPEYDFGDNYGKEDNIRAVFFRSVCEGRETKVFGYLGIPKTEEGKKVPGVVLVHGGGGTAFDDWVKMWTDRGYAALALDTEGNIPVKGNKLDWQEHPASPYFGKPNARFQDTADDVNNTWMHYATASVMAAANLLKSLPQVDENKVGVCGISWGGVITMITTCYYNGFAFSVPIYLAMHVKNSGVAVDVNYNTECADVWEASPITGIKAPMLFIGDISDACTSVTALSACAEDIKGDAYLSFQAGFGHSHVAGASRTESMDFADYIVKGGPAPVRFYGLPDDKEMKVRFDPRGNDVVETGMYYCDKVRSIEKEDWHTVKAEIKDGYMQAEKEVECKVFFFYAKNKNGNIYTSLAKIKE